MRRKFIVVVAVFLVDLMALASRCRAAGDSAAAGSCSFCTLGDGKVCACGPLCVRARFA